MNLKNRYNFWKMKQDLAPSKVFKAGLWCNLNQAWNAQYGRPTWLQIGLLHKGAALAVVVLLLIGSTGAYAYVSPEVTEGTALYPLKQAVESVEGAIKITPEAKAKFYLKQIKRREAEKARLVRKNFRQTEVQAPEKIEERPDFDFESESGIHDFAEEKSGQNRDKIQRTEKSIEKMEDRLEKTEKVIGRMRVKDEKLREEVKNRLEIRLERRQKQIEKKAEKQKERMEKLETLKAKGREIQKY